MLTSGSRALDWEGASATSIHVALKPRLCLSLTLSRGPTLVPRGSRCEAPPSVLLVRVQGPALVPRGSRVRALAASRCIPATRPSTKYETPNSESRSSSPRTRSRPGPRYRSEHGRPNERAMPQTRQSHTAPAHRHTPNPENLIREKRIDRKPHQHQIQIEIDPHVPIAKPRLHGSRAVRVKLLEAKHEDH